MNRMILAAALVAMSSAAMAENEAIYRTDAAGNIVSLDHIFLDFKDCRPGGEMVGTVVDRDFPKMGVVPNAFVLEDTSGNRTYINVPDDYRQLSRVQASWVASGLNTFIKKGVVVIAGVKSCGNGPVIMLDSLRAAHRE